MKQPRVIVGLIVASLLLPTLAIAQTTTSFTADANSQLLAALEQLVVELTNELQQLIAQHAGNSTSGSSTSTSTGGQGSGIPFPTTVGTPTCTLSLDNSVVYPGEGATLSWTSANATTGTITQGIGVVSPSGSRFIPDLTQNVTWIGSFKGAGGTAACSISLTVAAGSTGASTSFKATPTNGTAPLTVTFSGASTDVGSTVSFGDGSSAQTISQIACTASVPPSCTYGTTHTYNSPGFYIVNLKSSSGALENVTTVLVTATTTSQSGGSSTTTPSTIGSCVAFTTTYQNGTTIWYIGKPGPGVGQVLGLTASQWTCSNGQWANVPFPSWGGSTSTPPIGGSCTFIGHTYPNGGTVSCTEDPSDGGCPVGIPVATWSCNDGTWVAPGQQNGGSPSSCPVYTFPACTNGTYIQQQTGSNGCTIPGHYVCSSTGLSASPTSGAAPLTVNFTGVGTVITFGDGITQAQSDGVGIVQTSHTYTNAGTYTATSGGSSVVITVNSSSQPQCTPGGIGGAPFNNACNPGSSCVAINGSQTSTGFAECNGELYCPNNAASQRYYCQIGGVSGGFQWSSAPCTGEECLSE